MATQIRRLQHQPQNTTDRDAGAGAVFEPQYKELYASRAAWSLSYCFRR